VGRERDGAYIQFNGLRWTFKNWRKEQGVKGKRNQSQNTNFQPGRKNKFRSSTVQHDNNILYTWKLLGQVWWLIPVIPASQEVDIGRIKT
jgi:hypothetical protein